MAKLKTTPVAFVFAFAFAALVAGCGGDSAAESTAVATSSITKPEFVRRADAICRPGEIRLARQVSSYQEEHLDEPSANTVPGAASAVIKPLLSSQAARIRSLGAPAGDAAEIEKFLATLLDGVDEIIAEKPETFNEAQSMIEPAVAIARRYGIARCEYTILGYLYEGRPRR